MRFDLLNIIRELNEEESDTKIIARLGKTGSGKTLRQTEENVLPLLLDGQEVWCCYWLNWNKPNLHYFAPKDFDKVKNLRNSTIVFDETRRSFEPRSWEGESEDFRSFVELHRHRHNTIILNTQDISLISKTFAIQAHQWSQLERVDKPFLLKILDKILGREVIVLQEDFLTFGELKKMANGWELNQDVDIDADWQIVRYKKSELLHRELDEFKIELVHKYCSRCKSRQGSQILKDMTDKECEAVYDNKGVIVGYTLRNKEYCPKHKETELTVRFSGMFDTDYEPEKQERIVRTVLYETCDVCGKEHIAK